MISSVMQLLVNQLEPLTEQQLAGIYNLQQSSHQAEDALSQGMEALQQSLAETLANGSPATEGSSGDVANYMGQMAMAMGKLGTLEGFLRQVNLFFLLLPILCLFKLFTMDILRKLVQLFEHMEVGGKQKLLWRSCNCK